MKLRCTHNSIRIRVRKSDLAALADQGMIQEEIALGNQTAFIFVLQTVDGAEDISADMEAQSLIVTLPLSAANQWMESQQVGMEVRHPLEGEESLHILIEKDFPCLDRADEDKSDTFTELVPDQPETC